jgi:hypothetical protein
MALIARILSFAKLFRHAENRYRFIELHVRWKPKRLDQWRAGVSKSLGINVRGLVTGTL